MSNLFLYKYCFSHGKVAEVFLEQGFVFCATPRVRFGSVASDRSFLRVRGVATGRLVADSRVAIDRPLRSYILTNCQVTGCQRPSDVLPSTKWRVAGDQVTGQLDASLWIDVFTEKATENSNRIPKKCTSFSLCNYLVVLRICKPFVSLIIQQLKIATEFLKSTSFSLCSYLVVFKICKP